MARYVKYLPYFRIDGISLFFVVLSAFLIPLCLLAGWESIERQKSMLLPFLS